MQESFVNIFTRPGINRVIYNYVRHAFIEKIFPLIRTLREDRITVITGLVYSWTEDWLLFCSC
jgi:hypothetical protein